MDHIQRNFDKAVQKVISAKTKDERKEAKAEFYTCEKRLRKRDILPPVMYIPRLRTLVEELSSRLGNKIQGGLKCPKCGDPDMGNVMAVGKGKRKKRVPYCFKCNKELVHNNEKRVNIRLIKEDTATLRKLRGLPEPMN